MKCVRHLHCRRERKTSSTNTRVHTTFQITDSPITPSWHGAREENVNCCWWCVWVCEAIYFAGNLSRELVGSSQLSSSSHRIKNGRFWSPGITHVNRECMKRWRSYIFKHETCYAYRVSLRVIIRKKALFVSEGRLPRNFKSAKTSGLALFVDSWLKNAYKRLLTQSTGFPWHKV